MPMSESDELYAQRLLQQIKGNSAGMPMQTPQQTQQQSPISRSESSGDPHQGPYADKIGSTISPQPAQQIPQNVHVEQKPFEPAPLEGQFGGACHECGLLHPPLQPGEKCPNAPIKVKCKDGKEKVVDPTNFLSKMKDIIVSQMGQKQIEDSEKFFNYLTLELTKAMERYEEK